MEPLTWALYEKGRSLDALSYRRSLARLQQVARKVVSATMSYNVLLTPALAQRPVPIGTITGMERPDPVNALSLSDRFAPYTALWNVTGQPAISLPLFHGDDGLPVGVQLVGTPADDTILLTLAGQLEQTVPWRRKFSPLALGPQE